MAIMDREGQILGTTSPQNGQTEPEPTENTEIPEPRRLEWDGTAKLIETVRTELNRKTTARFVKWWQNESEKHRQSFENLPIYAQINANVSDSKLMKPAILAICERFENENSHSQPA